jgi:hypothetical protein
VLRNAETIVIVTLSMIPYIDLLWHMVAPDSRHINQGVLEVALGLDPDFVRRDEKSRKNL